MDHQQVYVGDYVRLRETYLKSWKTEKPSRVKDLRDTIYLVIESTRCYSWRYGILGGGMLLTLKPYLGPLAKKDDILGRGEESVEIVQPDVVDDFLRDFMGSQIVENSDLDRTP